MRTFPSIFEKLLMVAAAPGIHDQDLAGKFENKKDYSSLSLSLFNPSVKYSMTKSLSVILRFKATSLSLSRKSVSTLADTCVIVAIVSISSWIDLISIFNHLLYFYKYLYRFFDIYLYC